MRELKFRAWDDINGEMVYQIIGQLSAGKLLDRFDDVMQWTGLKDKKGKEVYEDDIIKDIEGWIGIVKWNIKDCMFYVEYHTQNESMMFDDAFGDSEKNAEIIGNVYENPELLYKGEKIR